MRKRAAIVSVLVLEAVVVALSALFYLRARVAIAEAFGEYGTRVPAPAEVAISPWFLPLAVAFGALLCASSLVAPLKRSRRMALLGTGLVVSSFALVFAVAASFVAIFRSGG